MYVHPLLISSTIEPSSLRVFADDVLKIRVPSQHYPKHGRMQKLFQRKRQSFSTDDDQTVSVSRLLALGAMMVIAFFFLSCHDSELGTKTDRNVSSP